MKKLRLLLSFFLLCVGANVMAQYGHYYNDYTKDGITYKLYRNDSGTKDMLGFIALHLMRRKS